MTDHHALPHKQSSRQLFVLGSMAGRTDNDLIVSENGYRKICAIPGQSGDRLILSDQFLKEWIDQINRAFENYRQVIAITGRFNISKINIIKQLPLFLARMIAGVIEKTSIEQLVISGGSTASRIMRFLSWKRLSPVFEISPGIVALKVLGKTDCHVIIKPGSYPWPSNLLILK